MSEPESAESESPESVAATPEGSDRSEESEAAEESDDAPGVETGAAEGVSPALPEAFCVYQAGGA
ncbi:MULTISPECIES: hypothetical protein [unclassified Streptomyces]|uniref:Uncharacterized protein n=1 Tax=Streptomyces venezuelae TaxID=54571 RepID=A0A5P2BKZ8_STRVZ|nr:MULTISPECIES: hypothetical protein [unclassified Streptomyces]NEA04447.1 hypothetical protein [Streptomyces sp. SID10116]QES29811.1 hypothetical protein DEJ47_28205 [Streptomyces venezuelae]MYY86307.1 hypothetical protein [Streptomyces sp. SID335]MYZ13387.1 hypothetical protein [Streptomyces sp. SID337]NDZ90044.1 hypothetical protein [Streptomyces sp. SID10115]